MKRIRDEFYAIKGVFNTGRSIFKHTKSVMAIVDLFISKGEYITLDGKTKRGTYYSFMRDFWVE